MSRSLRKTQQRPGRGLPSSALQSCHRTLRRVHAPSQFCLAKTRAGPCFSNSAITVNSCSSASYSLKIRRVFAPALCKSLILVIAYSSCDIPRTLSCDCEFASGRLLRLLHKGSHDDDTPPCHRYTDGARNAVAAGHPQFPQSVFEMFDAVTRQRLQAQLLDWFAETNEALRSPSPRSR